MQHTMKINPYKIGMNFYIILIVFVLTLLGCKTFENVQDRIRIKQDANNVLQTPDLTKTKK
jgi:hypothetical protein